jgi:hypothetical protein
MLSLTIHHNIHLTREEAYALHAGEEVVTTGYSVPVWFYNKLTSEPARELFCRYILKNPKKDVPIQIMDFGYDISIPYREGTKLEISDEEWRHLNMNDRDKLDALYKKTVSEVSSKNLLDHIDGGIGQLYYREHNKVKKGNDLLSIMHFVCIARAESMVPTIQSV